MGDVAKISFQTQSHSKHEYLHSKQQPTIDKSAEAQHAERGLYPHKKKRLPNDSHLCLSLPDHRTFIEDYLKILDFIEWLKEYYPDKVPQLSHRK